MQQLPDRLTHHLDYEWYDGPLLSLFYEHYNSYFLAQWIDVSPNNQHMWWMYVPMTLLQKEAFQNRRMDFYQALSLSEIVFVVEHDGQTGERRWAVPVPLSQIPKLWDQLVGQYLDWVCPNCGTGPARARCFSCALDKRAHETLWKAYAKPGDLSWMEANKANQAKIWGTDLV